MQRFSMRATDSFIFHTFSLKNTNFQIFLHDFSSYIELGYRELESKVKDKM